MATNAIFYVTKKGIWYEFSAQWNILVSNCFYWNGSLIKKGMIDWARWIFSTWAWFRGGVWYRAYFEIEYRTHRLWMGPKLRKFNAEKHQVHLLLVTKISKQYKKSKYFTEPIFQTSFTFLWHIYLSWNPPPPKKMAFLPLSSPSAHSEMSMYVFCTSVTKVFNVLC